MINARQKILKYVIEEQSATVEELSKVFKVTQANIRHHLSILVDQGSVKITGQRAQEGKGRPAQIYTAAQQVDQNNLEQLADTLLSTLLATSQPEGALNILHAVARQMAESTILDRHNPTRRVYSSIRALNRMSYQAHWEAHFDNPRIMLGHCPYQAILEHHPEICQLDAFLLQELLDTPVQHAERLGLNDKGLPECIFIINQHVR